MIEKNYETVLQLLKDNEYKFDHPDAMDDYLKWGFIKKDIVDEEQLQILELISVNIQKGEFNVLCENLLEIPLLYKKEKKFFELNNLFFSTTEEALKWLDSENGRSWFKTGNFKLIATEENEVIKGSLFKNFILNKQTELFNQIKDSNKIYKAKILEKNRGGFIAIIDGIKTFLPGSLAAANKIIDFNNFIGKSVDVMIEDYLKDDKTFIVSNKKYILYVIDEKLKNLEIGKLYFGKVTGISKFSIFIEWDDLFTGLLHLSEMTEEEKLKFNKGFYQSGSDISFYIKQITNDNKIILTNNKEENKSITIEDFKNKFEKSYLEGKIFNITDYGTFVKFNYENDSFVGLLYYKDYPNNFEPKINDKLNLLINFVDTKTNKIYLKLKK
jgi:small subunit ribosomal protein S1